MAATCSAVKTQVDAPPHILFDRRRQRFLQKRAASRKKLDRPTGDDEVLSFHRPTTIAQVFENGPRICNPGAGLGVRFNENMDTELGDRLQIARRSHRAADSVAFNNTVSLHTVDHLDDFSYAHAARISSKRL